MPPDFPLEDGRLTCLSCHNATLRCTMDPAVNAGNPLFLRGSIVEITGDYCFRCHTREHYRPVNAHDQMETDQIKEDGCLWCHVNIPDRNTTVSKGALSNLRNSASGICVNCHFVGPNHPVEGKHMGSTPSSDLLFFMAAAEIRDRMNIPFASLLEMVRASGRMPRQIPLDEQNRITCYTCHNPHEKDLLPASNPHTVGAEPDKAVTHRLRIRQGSVCSVCHDK